MMAKIVSGELKVDSDYNKLAATEHVALNIVE